MQTISMSLSIALWAACIGYWAYAARRGAGAEVDEREPVSSRRFHLLLFYGSVLLQFVPRVFPMDWRFLPATGTTEVVGLVVQASGLSWALWARTHLGENWNGAVQHKAGQKLEIEGPYRFVRHPIYSGFVFMFLGSMIVSGEVHALLGFAIGAGAYARKLRLEERLLPQVYGDQYIAYRERTPALIPRVNWGWVLARARSGAKRMTTGPFTRMFKRSEPDRA